MQLQDIKLIYKNKKKKRIARGGKKGTTAGRGTKGQKSRTGHNIRPAERDLIKKLPKLRGYRFKAVSPKAVVFNIGDMDVKFNAGDTITPKLLWEKGMLGRKSGQLPAVKFLGKGELAKKLFFKDCLISGSAKEKIEKAGGKVENAK